MSFLEIMFLFLITHALVDYPLQGDFLSRAKNPLIPIAGIDWYIPMSMHCLLHAGTVWLVSGNIYLGLTEFILHFTIDTSKCYKKISFKTDQYLHILCRILYTILILHYQMNGPLMQLFQ